MGVARSIAAEPCGPFYRRSHQKGTRSMDCIFPAPQKRHYARGVAHTGRGGATPRPVIWTLNEQGGGNVKCATREDGGTKPRRNDRVAPPASRCRYEEKKRERQRTKMELDEYEDLKTLNPGTAARLNE